MKNDHILYIIIETIIGTIISIIVILDTSNLLLIIGLLMIFSPIFKNKFYIFGYFYWICTDFFRPKSSKNPYIWGVINIIIGFLMKFNQSQ